MKYWWVSTLIQVVDGLRVQRMDSYHNLGNGTSNSTIPIRRIHQRVSYHSLGNFISATSSWHKTVLLRKIKATIKKFRDPLKILVFQSCYLARVRLTCPGWLWLPSSSLWCRRCAFSTLEQCQTRQQERRTHRPLHSHCPISKRSHDGIWKKWVS